MMLLLVSRQAQMDTLLHRDGDYPCSVAMIRIDSMAYVHSTHPDFQTPHCRVGIVTVEHICPVGSGFADKVAV